MGQDESRTRGRMGRISGCGFGSGLKNASSRRVSQDLARESEGKSRFSFRESCLSFCMRFEREI